MEYTPTAPFNIPTDAVIFQSEPAIRGAPISSLTIYLDIYHYKLYPIWPVINKDALLCRLRNFEDASAYALATAVCGATIVQLQLGDSLPEGSSQSPHRSLMIAEAEKTIFDHNINEMPTAEAVLISFFLHVYYANIGKFNRSTLLLRQAVSLAHIIGMHRDIYYHAFDNDLAQEHLRASWLLFITERYVLLAYHLMPL